ncbi:MAG: hypothetical protein CWE10_20280 [Symbiobacterium thermophilum]|uniref:Uncharacterized protein n=2 Tax=Symbiobacterium thermophilum TaxID=2734 RepID=A0A953LLQ4_SYMTR|nr:hypothetical protein [Symbiobacterium thermophilum]
MELMRRYVREVDLEDMGFRAQLHGLEAELVTGADGAPELRLRGDDRAWSSLCQGMVDDPPFRPRRIVLISTARRRDAEQLAAERGLQREGWDWQFIPQHPRLRCRALRDAYALSEDDLVGQWLDEERQMLLKAGAELVRRTGR